MRESIAGFLVAVSVRMLRPDMRNLARILGILLLTACAKKNDGNGNPPPRPPEPPPQASTGDRVAAVAKSHPHYDRVEGVGFENACSNDSACVKGGCSSEVCSADEVTTTCELPEGGFPGGDECGCVAGECIWYRSKSAAAESPAQGTPCPEGRCAEGLTCMEYYGVAGPKGPKLTSCEIACSKKSTCPAGQSCITIADGPGSVCRPQARDEIQ